MKIIQKKAKVLSNLHLISNYYKLMLALPEIAQIAQPGQFVMLKVTEGYQPLLRRPFSVHRVSHKSGVTSHKSKIKRTSDLKLTTCDSIEILYEVVGKGTEILSQRRPGEYLDVLGPLGNGFSILNARSSILVAGGMGIAPLLFLAERVSIQHPCLSGRHPASLPVRQAGSIQVLIGAKTKKEILCKKEFAKLDCNVKISTDDGSAGFKGKVTELLKNILRKTQDARRKTLYACGPKLMLKEIAVISEKYNIPAQISLEEHMACGIGVCLGCVIKVKSKKSKGKSDFEYKCVCKEGPVFDASTINFNG